MCQHQRTTATAFTLIELLVVIGIIALLVGILLPVLGTARQHARMIREMSALRQLSTVYQAYATDHDGQLMPGHTPYIGQPLTDDLGRPLTAPEVANRWVWRLLSATQQRTDGLVLVNEQAEALGDPDAFFWNYFVSVGPTFGLNVYGVGGYYTSPAAAPVDRSMVGCVKRLSQAKSPSRLLTYSTAGSEGDQQTTTYGYWRVSPPTRPYEGGVSGWTADPYLHPDSGPPTAWGWVHARWYDKALTAMLDGHVETLGIEALRDMTYWSDAAARANDPTLWPGHIN